MAESTPKQVGNAQVSVFDLDPTIPVKALGVINLDSSGGIATVSASTQVSIKEILTSSGTSVMDSTEGAIKVNVVAGSAAGSTTVSVSTGSVRVHQSTAADLNAAVVQGSTVWAAQIDGRVRAQNSTIGDFLASVQQNSTVWETQISGRIRAQNSTIGDFLASVQQNSSAWQVQPGSTNWPKAAGLSVDSSNVQNVKLDGSTAITIGSVAGAAGRLNIGSTATDNVANVSSVAGIVAVRPSDTNWASSAGFHFNSSGAVVVDQGSTVFQTQARIQDSSGVGFLGTTTRPSTGAQGLGIRTILNDLQSTTFSTAGNNSTTMTLVSSVAGQRVKVYAYSITSTAQAVNTLSFASSNANNLWSMQMQSMSSGITGANLAVSPPAWLFATEAASALVFRVTGTTGTYHVSVSYFVEA